MTVMQRKMHAALSALGPQRTAEQDEWFARLENLRRDELAREEDAAYAERAHQLAAEQTAA